MVPRPTDPETAEHDAVMSWLQNREMKDHGLADARSGIINHVLISAVIGRTQAKAYTAFPHIDRDVLDDFVRDYVNAPSARNKDRAR